MVALPFGFILLILAAVCVISPAARRVAGWAAAALVLVFASVVTSVVGHDLRRLREHKEALERIAASEVRLDALELSGMSQRDFRLRGFVHNLSTRYTLTDATFDLIVEDCVAGNCHEQARGHSEVIRRVAPGETVAFDTDNVALLGPRLPAVSDASHIASGIPPAPCLTRAEILAHEERPSLFQASPGSLLPPVPAPAPPGLRRDRAGPLTDERLSLVPPRPTVESGRPTFHRLRPDWTTR